MKWILILLISTNFSLASTTEPEIEELLTTDVLGYSCVQEDDLDLAFINAGKGASVPQTCMPEILSKDCDNLTDLMGRDPTAQECATYAYRWLSTVDPNQLSGWGWDCGDCEVVSTSAKIPQTPLPASLVMLLSAFALLCVIVTIKQGKCHV
jgi:hypothetical protein